MDFYKFSHSDLWNSERRELHKSSSFDNKIIMVNGFNGSGKTLFSPLVSSIKNVELMSFAYEIEWCSSFLYSGQMDSKAYGEFVKLYVDHLVYNQLMSRSVNFRPSDLSSALNYRPRWRYLARLFQEGDNAIPEKVRSKQPILSLTTCHLMPILPSLSRALKQRLLFIEIVRDPVFMFQQLLILHRTVLATKLEKDFTLRVSNPVAHSTYLDYYSSPEVFAELVGKEDVVAVISYLERMFRFYFDLDLDNIERNGSSFMLIPFEHFVLSPFKWMESIVEFAGQPWTKSIDAEMRRQKVPRKLLRMGRKLPVYKRFGWGDDDLRDDMTLEEENQAYRHKIAGLIGNPRAYQRLEKLSDEYREWTNSRTKYIFNA